MELQCNLCNHTFKRSYTKMNAHFLKTPSKGVGACKKMKSKDYEKYERENDEAKLRVKNAHPKMILLPRPTKVMKKRRAN